MAIRHQVSISVPSFGCEDDANGWRFAATVELISGNWKVYSLAAFALEVSTGYGLIVTTTRTAQLDHFAIFHRNYVRLGMLMISQIYEYSSQW